MDGRVSLADDMMIGADKIAIELYGNDEQPAVRDVYRGVDGAVAGAAGAAWSQGRVLEIQCCEIESVLPSGSVNHATLAPPGAVQTPSGLWSK